MNYRISEGDIVFIKGNAFDGMKGDVLFINMPLVQVGINNKIYNFDISSLDKI